MEGNTNKIGGRDVVIKNSFCRELSLFGRTTVIRAADTVSVQPSKTTFPGAPRGNTGFSCSPPTPKWKETQEIHSSI